MSKNITRESLGYAVLLIVLCAIAALAAHETIAFLDQKLLLADYTIAATMIWTLTLGFMLISGAFGLWSVNFAAEAEGQRRVSKLVGTMDYILDGLITIDTRGNITGANAAALNISGSQDINKQPLIKVFSCLSPDDIKLLTNKKDLSEIEKTFFCNKKFRSLRFRSQPSKGLSLILISDVTFVQEQKDQRRQETQLQLIGEIAKGVANDFDNLLCGISADATILRKFSPNTPELQTSAERISSSAEKGTLLARKLNDLANSSSPTNSSRLPNTYVQTAIDKLQTVLSEEWNIIRNIDPLLPTSLTGSKLEQVVLNLGIIVTDSLGQPGTLFVTAQTLPDDAPEPLKERCSCIITICASENRTGPLQNSVTTTTENDHQGVLLSIIRSLIMEAGGSLESSNIINRQYTFTIALAHGQESKNENTISVLPKELAQHIATRSVLLATADMKHSQLQDSLLSYGAKITEIDNIIALLVELDKSKSDFSTLIFDDQLAERETETILKTITKLRPDMVIIVLAEDANKHVHNSSANIMFITESATTDEIIMGMIETEKAVEA